MDIETRFKKIKRIVECVSPKNYNTKEAQQQYADVIINTAYS